MIAKLVPLDDGPPIELKKDMTLVGRNEDCDVRIDHKSVSKQHCVLVLTDGLILIRDLGSTNGTRVNGQRVRRAALLPNDQLAIANYKYQVLFGEAAHDANKADAKKTETPPEPVKVNALPDNYA
jgi:pSer/pThr/pTyr-binding forkhead associated (FHA) protein